MLYIEDILCHGNMLRYIQIYSDTIYLQAAFYWSTYHGLSCVPI